MKYTWLGPQVFCGSAPSPEKLKPVSNKRFAEEPAFPSAKPGGGIWTSSRLTNWHLVNEGRPAVSDWHDWCLNEGFGHHSVTSGTGWVLEPEPCRVFIIDSNQDLNRLLAECGCQEYPARLAKSMLSDRVYPDWEEVFRRYDAVHLTHSGQWATRFSEPSNLYGWDVESTLWGRWKFVGARRIQFTPMPDDMEGKREKALADLKAATHGLKGFLEKRKELTV